MTTDEEKLALRESILAEPVLARLATANGKSLQPHVVPVWFMWDGSSLWIHCYMQTRKYKDLASNPKGAVLVETAVKNNKLQCVLLEGSVELVSEPRELVKETAGRIYRRYLNEEEFMAKDPQSWINDPEIHLIKLTPKKIRAW